jgi:regulator of replication initiation timing
MARHPDVSEKEIIDAALDLEKRGKTPNPGAIRAALGFKGGLVRIRDVWDKYQAKRNGSNKGTEPNYSLDDLPSEIADATGALVSEQKLQLERIVVESFQRCQTLFDKRLDDHIAKYDRDVAFYKDYETNADDSIERLESEIKEMQADLKELAGQNASLLIDNSKLSGQVLAYEKSIPLADSKAFNAGRK